MNSTERDIAILCAKKRYSDNRKTGNVNQKAGPQSDEITELQGIAGEMVVAKALNVCPGFDDQPGKYDLIYKGQKVEVKTTAWPNGELRIDPEKASWSDVFILVVGKFPDYRIAGWVPQYMLIKKNNLQPIKDGGKVMYRLTQSQLYPLERLI